MRKHSCYYLNDFLALAHPTDKVVDNIIQTKHNYLLIYTSTDEEYLISEKQYVHDSFKHDYWTNKSELKVKIKDKIYTICDIPEIIGFSSFDVALTFCGENTDCLCSKPDEKLIFSPQLARYLLKHEFRIIDIKPKKDNSKEFIPVFIVEDGFYDCIKDWKQTR